MGCGAILVIAVILGLAGGGFVYYVGQDPAGLQVYVETPDQVAKDDLFDLKVMVVNERKGQSLKVTSIDLAESYLAGFTVRSTEPVAKSSQRVPLEGGQSFGFDKVVSAGTTNIFIFHLRAAKTGLHRGDVDVCEGMRFLTAMAQTEVK
jgi:hypothetical protein